MLSREAKHGGDEETYRIEEATSVTWIISTTDHDEQSRNQEAHGVQPQQQDFHSPINSPDIDPQLTISDTVNVSASKQSGPDFTMNSIRVLASHAKKASLRVAHEFNLALKVIHKKIPIDTLLLGRAGVGKSQLLKAITKRDDIEVSPQLAHVTQNLKAVTITVDNIPFRFWDSRGIDKWTDSKDSEALIKEVKSKGIKPLFIIYCAAVSGRVDPDAVYHLLKSLQGEGVPIAYVITNMYAGSGEMRKAQIEGGLEIMKRIFPTEPKARGSMHYEFHEPMSKKNGCILPAEHGILIAVNSSLYKDEDFEDSTVRREEKNVCVLMEFIANSLDDDRLLDFFLLTLNNRGFWEKASDVLKSRIDEIWNKLSQCGKVLSRSLSELYKA